MPIGGVGGVFRTAQWREDYRFEVSDGRNRAERARRMLRKIIPAKNKQPSVSKYVMHRRECPIHIVRVIEPKPVHPIENDAVELASLEVPFQMLTGIDDVLSSSKALLATIDFKGCKVLRRKEARVVKRVPRAAHK